MAHISNATHIDVAGATVAHHCNHKDGTTSWRLDGHGGFGSVYLSGTVADLRAFGESVLRAAESFVAPVAREEAVQS